MPFVVGGGTGRRLLGAARRPGDLDLECDPADAPRAAAALGLPRPATDRGGGWSSLRSRGLVAGVEVDLSAGVAVDGPHGRLPADHALLVAWSVPVRAVAVDLWCAPPEEALVRALVAGDLTRLARVAARGGPPPRIGYVSARLAAASASR